MFDAVIPCRETSIKTPVFPHCEKEIAEMLGRKTKSFFEVHECQG